MAGPHEDRSDREGELVGDTERRRLGRIHNERLKLLANAFNTAAAFTFTTGIIGPAIASYLRIGPLPADLALADIVFGALNWFVAAAGLHWIGSESLRSMRDE